MSGFMDITIRLQRDRVGEFVEDLERHIKYPYNFIDLLVAIPGKPKEVLEPQPQLPAPKKAALKARKKLHKTELTKQQQDVLNVINEGHTTSWDIHKALHAINIKMKINGITRTINGLRKKGRVVGNRTITIKK